MLWTAKYLSLSVSLTCWLYSLLVILRCMFPSPIWPYLNMQKVCIPNILFKTVCNQYYYYSIHSKYFAKSIFQSIYSEYFALSIFNSIHSEYIYFFKQFSLLTPRPWWQGPPTASPSWRWWSRRRRRVAGRCRTSDNSVTTDNNTISSNSVTL